MEPISLVTLKSRRCARLPPWRPRGPRASPWPCQSPLLSPGDSVTSQAGTRTQPGFPQPGAGLGGAAGSGHSEHPGAGARPRPCSRNKAGGGGEAQAGLFLPHPHPSTAGALPGPSYQDVAGPGASPAGAEGPETGHQLFRVPRTRPPAAARTLVRDRTGKCAVLSPAPRDPETVPRREGARIPSLPTLASECLDKDQNNLEEVVWD